MKTDTVHTKFEEKLFLFMIFKNLQRVEEDFPTAVIKKMLT